MGDFNSKNLERFNGDDDPRAFVAFDGIIYDVSDNFSFRKNHKKILGKNVTGKMNKEKFLKFIDKNKFVPGKFVE